MKISFLDNPLSFRLPILFHNRKTVEFSERKCDPFATFCHIQILNLYHGGSSLENYRLMGYNNL